MRPYILLSFIAIALVTSTAAHGQVGHRVPTYSHGDYVVQDGGAGLTPQVMNLVAEKMHPRLEKWPEDVKTSVQISFDGAKVNDADILSLYVGIPADEFEPSEEDKRQLWELARTQLESELRRVLATTGESRSRRGKEELARAEEERARVDGEAAEAAELLAKLQAESAGAERENLAKAIAESVSKLRGLQLEQAGGRARREAIEKRIDELRARHASEGDAIVEELEKLVKIRTEAFNHIESLVDVGQAATSEIADSQAQLAEARIEWLRAQQAAEERFGGGALHELNNELSKLLVDAAEIEGQRKQLEQIVAELRDQVRVSARAATEVGRLQDRMQELRNRRASLDARINNLVDQLGKQVEQQISLQPLAAPDSDTGADNAEQGSEK